MIYRESYRNISLDYGLHLLPGVQVGDVVVAEVQVVKVVKGLEGSGPDTLHRGVVEEQGVQRSDNSGLTDVAIY